MFHWADAAVEHERRAREGREQVLRDHAAADTPRMTAELHAAMVAVSACAHSLDALYAELAELVGPETFADWEKIRRPGRWAEVAGIIGLAFDVDVADWRPRLRSLFKLRNDAVHPKVRFESPQKHPALPVNVASEYLLFSVESATESVDLLLEILATCADAPRTELTEAWARDAVAPIKRLTDVRAAESG
jgi:hypothetical protein